MTSSPEYPQSNGLGERAVRSAKKLLETTKRDGTDFYLNLLHLRNTPRDRILGSPAQRLLSRRTRTVLPICKQLLDPAAKSTASIKAQLTKKCGAQKGYYDKSSRPLAPLLPNQVVRLQTQKGHEKLGMVRSNCGEPRSYVVVSEGREYRRNRRHLLPVQEPLLHQPLVPITHTNEQQHTQPQHAQYALPQHTQAPQTEIPDNTGTQPEPCHSTVNPETQEESVAQPSTSVYITRSGRVSKPNRKYCD